MAMLILYLLVYLWRLGNPKFMVNLVKLISMTVSDKYQYPLFLDIPNLATTNEWCTAGHYSTINSRLQESQI